MSGRPERRQGVLPFFERHLSSDTTALVAFSMLLSALHFTFWQYILAVIVYVHATTDAPAWLKAERAARKLSTPSNEGGDSG